MPEHLLHGYVRFRHAYFAGERKFLKRLATEGQNPSTLYIGCSDSRVIPELMTSAKPGDLFVVRNIANQAPPLENADASVGAAIDYAVAHLKVPHLVVCGHYGCGGVKAVMGGRDQLRDLPSLHEWLGGVVPAVERVRATGLDGEAAFRAAVEENVLLQLDRVLTYGAVQRALTAGALALHGWAYDILTSRLHVYDVEQDAFTDATKLL
jgi:carbonic anhydrase